MGLPQSNTVLDSSTLPSGMPAQYGLLLFIEWESSTHLSFLAPSSASQSLYIGKDLLVLSLTKLLYH